MTEYKQVTDQYVPPSEGEGEAGATLAQNSAKSFRWPGLLEGGLVLPLLLLLLRGREKGSFLGCSSPGAAQCLEHKRWELKEQLHPVPKALTFEGPWAHTPS